MTRRTAGICVGGTADTKKDFWTNPLARALFSIAISFGRGFPSQFSLCLPGSMLFPSYLYPVCSITWYYCYSLTNPSFLLSVPWVPAHPSTRPFMQWVLAKTRTKPPTASEGQVASPLTSRGRSLRTDHQPGRVGHAGGRRSGLNTFTSSTRGRNASRPAAGCINGTDLLPFSLSPPFPSSFTLSMLDIAQSQSRVVWHDSSGSGAGGGGGGGGSGEDHVRSSVCVLYVRVWIVRELRCTRPLPGGGLIGQLPRQRQ